MRNASYTCSVFYAVHPGEMMSKEVKLVIEQDKDYSFNFRRIG